jgi:hypothetical protein
LEYQEGMAWMKEPVDALPCKKSFAPTPEEELRKDMMEGVCGALQGEKKLPETGDHFPSTRRECVDGLIGHTDMSLLLPTNGGRKQEPRDPSSLTLLRRGSARSAIHRLNAEGPGN